MPPLDLNANLIHPDECTTWRPIKRHDGRDSICECGLNFFEHRLLIKEFPPMKDSIMTCKPWCHSIVKLGDAPCNCKMSAQSLIKEPQVMICQKWQESQSMRDCCICGLTWWSHTKEARRGFTSKEFYDRWAKDSKKIDYMSNEEAIAWLKLMGRTREDRISKIQDLLRNAKADKMEDVDKMMLEGLLDILNEEKFEEVAKEAAKHVQSYKPCPMCGEDMEIDRRDMCSLCVEMMLHESDAQHHEVVKTLIDDPIDEVSIVDPANGSIIVS